MAASRSSCSRSSAGAFQGGGRIVQHAADGEAGFQAVGRDRGAAVIFAVVAAAHRVGQRLDAAGPRRRDDGRQQRRRANALVVIADKHDVGVTQLAADARWSISRSSAGDSGLRSS